MAKTRLPTTDYRLPNQEAKLLAQGAEAKIFLEKSTIHKNRIPKTYRHKTLDKKIRTRRTRSEAKILTRALRAKINVPKLLYPNTKYQIPNTNKFHIHMEFINGDRLSQTLNNYDKKKQIATMQKIGRQVAKLHKNDIIHADLTTSNIILTKSHRRKPVSQAKAGLTGESRSHSEAVYLIDFGLSFVSTKIEDKAVDLHLLKQALEAKHFQNSKTLFNAFRQGYKWEDSEKIIERLAIVEKRGRYKH
jgi:tRNA A-37 threonylcarbamoyl transferase component Bud32